MDKNYTLQTEIYTVEQYMEETASTFGNVYELYGHYVKGFVWAMLIDNNSDYAQRLFAPIYSDSVVGHAQAMQAVTLELLDDYFKHIKK